MVVFLRATREYIVSQLADAGELPDHGYYHDLSLCKELGIDLTVIGTANYNNIVESISEKLGFDIPDVKHLNGGVNDYYNPYKRRLICLGATYDYSMIISRVMLSNKKRNLVRRLRISPNNKDKVTVIPVDMNQRTIHDKSWLEYIRNDFQEQYG